MDDFDAELHRRRVQGRLTQGDVDEVQRFAAFLTEMHAAGIPGPNSRTPEQQKIATRIYFEHYPEHAPPREEGHGRD